VIANIDAVAPEFADLVSWCEGSSPLYERLCALVVDDDFLLDVAADRDPPTYHLAGERPDLDRENGIQLRLERIDGTDSRSEHLGTFEQHGAWVAWRDSHDNEDAAGGPSVVHEDA